MPEPEREQPDGETHKGSGAARAIEQLVAAGKLLLVVAIFVFVVLNWSFFSDWLNSVRHAELPFGLKLDREQAKENIDKLFSGLHPREGSPEIARAALNQAELLGPAIARAKILWVDGNPDNNRYEREILESIGISVQLAWSTADALKFLEVAGEMPDLVISNLIRNGDQSIALNLCRAAYYDFPNDDLRAASNGNIWAFNATMQDKPPAGFAMAELMAVHFPALFANRQRPRIIFYTAASGGIASDQCAVSITNRPDVLLVKVVGTLAALRWQLLPDASAVEKALAQIRSQLAPASQPGSSP